MKSIGDSVAAGHGATFAITSPSRLQIGGVLMQTMDVNSYARKLLRAHGDKAELEAAQKATDCERSGEDVQASTWRRVQAAIKVMRGPNAS